MCRYSVAHRFGINETGVITKCARCEESSKMLLFRFNANYMCLNNVQWSSEGVGFSK